MSPPTPPVSPAAPPSPPRARTTPVTRPAPLASATPSTPRTTTALRYRAPSHPAAEYIGVATNRTRSAKDLANGYSQPCANSREVSRHTSACPTSRVSSRGTSLNPAELSRSATGLQNASCAARSSGKSYMGSEATPSAPIVVQADIRPKEMLLHHFAISAIKHQPTLVRGRAHLPPEVRQLKPG